MMKQTESFRYAEGDDYQAVELYYDGQELSMVILLPEAGQFKAFEEKLDVTALASPSSVRWANRDSRKSQREAKDLKQSFLG